MIVHDPRNPVAVRNAATLAALLDGEDLGDQTIVIGGDGFLLHTVDRLGLDRTYIGLNAGRVGFLLNDVDDWTRVAQQLRDRSVVASAFPVLEASYVTPEGHEGRATAINDLYLERASGQTARLALSVDGSQVVETLVADGIVVATALGSTAYTFSAGGPPCHPALQVLTVTPICPHQPRLSAFALPPSARVQVDVLHGERRPVRAIADGREIGQVRSVTIGYGHRQIRLGYFPNHDFTARMVRKILHP